MKKSIRYILFVLCIFACVLTAKVEAAELALEDSNYCLYDFTNWRSKLYVIPYYKSGGNWQGNSDGSIKLLLYDRWVDLNDTNKEKDWWITVNDRLGKYAKYNIKSGIEMDSSGKITKCPDLCGTNLEGTPDRWQNVWEGDIYFHKRMPYNNFDVLNEVKKDTKEDFDVNGCIPSNRQIQDVYAISEAGVPVNAGSAATQPEEPKPQEIPEIEKYNCDTMFTPEAVALVAKVLGYIQFLVPVVLIVMISTDMVRAVVAQDDKQMKAAYAKSVKRIIAAITVFIIPLFVTILFKIPEIRKVLESSGIVENPLCLGKGTTPNPKPQEKKDSGENTPSIPNTKTVTNEEAGSIKIPSDWIERKNYGREVIYENASKTQEIAINMVGCAEGEGVAAVMCGSTAESAANNLKNIYSDTSKYNVSISDATVGDSIKAKLVTRKYVNEDILEHSYFFINPNGDGMTGKLLIRITIKTDKKDTGNLKQYVSSYKF